MLIDTIMILIIEIVTRGVDTPSIVIGQNWDSPLYSFQICFKHSNHLTRQIIVFGDFISACLDRLLRMFIYVQQIIGRLLR